MTTSPAKLNEYNAAELPARQLLEKLGWEFVPRETLAEERNNEREVLLKDRLRRVLLRLNQWLTEAQADRAIFDLEHVNETGLARNRRVHEYLTHGMPLTIDGSSGRETRIVRFFDFDHPVRGLNEYVVTTQFRVRRGNDRAPDEDDTRVIKPDLVLFVNGIPLVVMEAKAPSLMAMSGNMSPFDPQPWMEKGVEQLRRYQEAEPKWHGTGAPELFYYNLMCVAHCGAAAVYAGVGAPLSAYFQWKSILPHSEQEARDRFGVEPMGQAQLIIGLLSPATLLDVLRDYVAFEQEHGRLVKKLPRYQQYRAVGGAVERMLKGDKPEERGGVVWHTQGSGKSLTMLWLATKLRREPRLRNPTIVIVTDRRQLDRQISETFRNCGFPAPEQAGSTRDLRRLLTTGAGRTIMTTIQKFEEALDSPGGRLDVLNPSEDVVVMVDEAHRTQYGILGGRLSDALPNAVLVGFTGTPIDKGFSRSTMRRFGSLIDSYTIPQSVADGATVPIHYEARLPELAIEGPETLDKLYETMFGDYPPEVQLQMRRRYANKQTVAEAEQRIEMIALDIKQHFESKVRPNGFKAQVVAPTRFAALRYAEKLNDFNLNAFPIISTSPNDGAEYREARELDEDAITGRFVDPDGDVEILVVVDKLLTGFDAPVEQVLYLDHSLKDHTLLQAIARVNRRFAHKQDDVSTEKTNGLIVDYHGVSSDLETALSSFEWQEVQDSMERVKEDPSTVIDGVADKAEAHFRGRDLADTWDCVSVFAPDASTEGNYKADLFEQFNANYREFSRLMDQFLPDPRALKYRDRLARLTEIRAYARAQFLREDANVDWTAISAKVKKLLDERISAEIRELMSPVSILDNDFDEKVAKLPGDEARASMMEHAIRAHISEKLAENPAFYERLSERLEKIIRDLRERVITSAQASLGMHALRQEAHGEAGLAAKYGLTPVSFAIYELLEERGTPQGETKGVAEGDGPYRTELDEETRDVAKKVESAIAKHTSIVDWQSNLDIQRLMLRDIKRELRPGGEYTEAELNDLAQRIVSLAISRSSS